MSKESKTAVNKQTADLGPGEFADGVPVAEVVGGLREGSGDAQELVFKTFYNRLVAVATNKLRSMPRNSGDPEVAASSALRSFFRNIEKGKLDFKNRDSIEHFLLFILGEKVLGQRRKSKAEMRREDKIDGGDVLELAAVTSDELSVIVDNFFDVLDQRLTERERLVFARSLDGHTQQEIANALVVSLRLVQATMASVRTKARKILDEA